MAKDTSAFFNRLTLGVCYYPEHWDEHLWEDDLRRMMEHGIKVVRVFEFAWTVIEKEEGVFDFDFFDRFLSLCVCVGMKVILCTPTATPPAWLTHQYPETLNADRHGKLYHHGHRRHYNYNSAVYQRLCSRVVEELAKRYGQHPAVIGWQIDNEINCEKDEFCSQSDDEAFRVWLKERFTTLEALNGAIGATFWNQTYTSWDQVHLEQQTISGHGNPHMALLEKRFISRSARSFVNMQAELIARYARGRFVTTNGIFGHLDSHEMTRESLDFIMYDSYPNFGYSIDDRKPDAGDDLRDRASSMNLSRARSISSTFGVMEQQSGPGGWDFTMLQPMPKPGQMKLWTMQSVAHGADYVGYFRWRTCGFGTEIYWHGLNDYDNRPNRRLRELAETARMIDALSQVAGGRYEARAGILCDYLNEWDGERDKWHGPLDKLSRKNIFTAAQQSHTPVDLVYIQHAAGYKTRAQELSAYSLLFYPHPTILTRETAILLEAYVKAGGKLVFGSRTGYKDEFGRCPMLPMPGFAADLCGLEVEDYTFVRPEEEPPQIAWGEEAVPAPVFHDILAPHDGTQVLARFNGGYYDGKPALTKKCWPGGGAAYYLGSGFSREMAELLLRETGAAEPYAGEITCTPQVEVAVRVKDAVRFCFLLNYSGSAQRFALHAPWRDAVDGAELAGEQVLEPYGVRVLIKP